MNPTVIAHSNVMCEMKKYLLALVLHMVLLQNSPNKADKGHFSKYKLLSRAEVLH